MTPVGHLIKPGERQDWNKFILRFSEIIKKRRENDPVVAVAPAFAEDGRNVIVQVVSHHLTADHLAPIIVHFTDMLSRAYPDRPEIQAFKSATEQHLGKMIAVADVTKGTN